MGSITGQTTDEGPFTRGADEIELAAKNFDFTGRLDSTDILLSTRKGELKSIIAERTFSTRLRFRPRFLNAFHASHNLPKTCCLSRGSIHSPKRRNNSGAPARRFGLAKNVRNRGNQDLLTSLWLW